MKSRSWIRTLVLTLAVLAANGWLIGQWAYPRALGVLGNWLAPDRLKYIMVLLLALVLVGPPLWFTGRVQRIRRKRVWALRLLLLYNLLFSLAIGLLWKRGLVATATPSPSATASPRLSATTGLTPTATPSLAPTLVTTAEPVRDASLTPEPSAEPLATAHPAQTDWERIDRHALAAPAEVEGEVKRLADYLVGPARSDLEKTRAIYRWVSDRIAYDAEAFLKGDLPDGSVEVTLNRRMAVCDGYSRLTQALGQEAGLKMEIVSGFARIYGADTDKRENHAWNAVHLEEGWCLMDCTWGAGSLGDDRKFHKAFNDFYFLTPPEQLLATHRPREDRWQLVKSPLSWEEFQAQPKRMPGFFRLGLSFVGPAPERLQADPSATVEVRAPKGIQVMAGLRRDGVDLEGHPTVVHRQGESARIHALAPAPGDYQLLVYAAPIGQTQLEGVAEFSVRALSGDPAGYPEVYSALHSHQGQVLSPVRGVLTAGKQHFELIVPGAQGVYVNDWSTPLQRQGDRFRGEVEVKAGKTEIFARFSANKGQLLVGYQVR
jgi:hypothetical protein